MTNKNSKTYPIGGRQQAPTERNNRNLPTSRVTSEHNAEPGLRWFSVISAFSKRQRAPGVMESYSARNYRRVQKKLQMKHAKHSRKPQK